MDAARGAQGSVKGPGAGAGLGGFAAHCPRCRRESIFVEAHIAHRKHLLLMIATAGLWLVPWCAMILGKLLRPHRCYVCGWHKPEFRNTTQISGAPRPADPASAATTPKKMQPPTVE
jgi:hypothetical protein